MGNQEQNQSEEDSSRSSAGFWNHRVVRHEYLKGNYPEEGNYIEFAIHEAYYNVDGSLQGITDNPIAVESETIEELRWCLDAMQRALEKPVLNWPATDLISNSEESDRERHRS